jgi:hypothetical protein
MMSGRFLAFLIILAALITAATYLHSTEKTETQTDPGLSNLERKATVHGWPWGYYAEIVELVRYNEHQVAVIEYTQVYFEMLGQTYLVWFVTSLLLVSVVIIVAVPRQRQV